MAERTPTGTYYYVYDGQGDVVMLVDPPNGAPVAIMSPCPTKNQSGDQWNAPGTTALYEAIRQGSGASGALTDLGTGNLKLATGYSGVSGTGLTQLSYLSGRVRRYDDPGVCDPFNCEPLAPAAGDPTEASAGGAGEAPNLTPAAGSIGYVLPPDAQLVQGRFPQTSGANQTLYRADPITGAVTNYEVYDANGLPVQRVDLVGPEHGGVPTPHVHVFDRNVAPDGKVYINTGSFRPAFPEEVPQ